ALHADPERVHLAGLREHLTYPAEAFAIRIAGFRADKIRKPHFSTAMSGSQRRARPSPRARPISDALQRSLTTLVIDSTSSQGTWIQPLPAIRRTSAIAQPGSRPE